MIMAETVEGGAGLAWRLLATLEGGSLLLATSALLAYTARARITRKKRHRNVHRVLITNTSNPLGRALKSKLEARHCIVSTVTSEAGSGAEQLDVLVVIGSEPQEHSLNQLARLVSEDVYNNLKLMETLSPRLNHGGCIAWACAGASSGAYKDAIAAFDTVLQASLHNVAKSSHCDALWVGRCENVEQATERLLQKLMPSSEVQAIDSFTLRNAAHKVSAYVGRWLKIVT